MATDAQGGSDSPNAARKRYQGKLELTWTNKDQSLLAHEDGSYEWLPPSDYRVAEVRLLRDAAMVGDAKADSARARDNLLIRGDALHALTSLIEIQEFAREYAGKVKLVYLDPPFNTEQAFEHYDDALEHSVWLTMMRDRLELVERLLSPDGSVWVHCDDSEQAYLKVVMDDIFGRENFQASIVWQKRYSRDNRPAVGTVHDYILIYSPMGRIGRRSGTGSLALLRRSTETRTTTRMADGVPFLSTPRQATRRRSSSTRSSRPAAPATNLPRAAVGQ